MASISNTRETSQQLRASVTTWLGMLFLLVLLLMAVGGFVRLSESGLSLAGWPTVGGRVMPPISQQGWVDHYQLYLQDLRDLRQRKASGEAGIGIIPADPRSMQEFRTIYLTEFSHRFLAVLAFIVSMVCLVRLLRNPGLRHLAGGPLMGIVGLIVVQSLIGGALVLSGTATSWLFIHLATATLTLGCVLWALLLMLRGDKRPIDHETRHARRWIMRLAWLSLAVVLVQIMFGALSAGSRQYGMSTSWPLMNGELVPGLWQTGETLGHNLLDNPVLHQWIHRSFAWIVAGIVVAMALIPGGEHLGIRARIARRFTLSCLVTQMLLGISNVFSGASTFIAITHLMVAVVLFCGLVLVLFDCRHEPRMSAQAVPADRALGGESLEGMRV